MKTLIHQNNERLGCINCDEQFTQEFSDNLKQDLSENNGYVESYCPKCGMEFVLEVGTCIVMSTEDE